MFEPTILRREALTKMIQDLRTDDEQPMPLTAAKILADKTIDQTEFSWDVKKTKRDIGNFNVEGGAAGVREYEVIGQQAEKLATTFESDKITGATLLNLRNPGSQDLQQIAEDEVGRHQVENARLLNRQDEFMVAGALQGTLTLPIKMGAQVRNHSIDYMFSADHKLVIGDNQLGSDILATGWDDAAAPVLDDLDAIIQKVMEDSGWQLTHAWTSKEMLTKLIQNDLVRDYFRSTPAGQDYLKTGVIREFKGIMWHEHNQVYGSAPTRYIPKNRVIFTPNPDPAWGEFVSGASVVPGGVDSGSMRKVTGRFSYAKTTWNPPAAEIYFGRTALPAIYVPDAILWVDAF